MFADLPLKSIAESPTNPRKHFGDLRELAESIAKKGVLQPILVRPKGKGYELVAGHRRLRAAAAAGLDVVPAMVREMTDEEVLEAQLIENCQRSDIHAMEEAEGYRRLMASKTGYDAARIAEKVGKSVAYVYDRLKLLSLTPAAQALFLDGKIAAGHAIILARLSPADQARAIGKPGEGPLLHGEHLLWDPEDKKREPGLKAITARELQAWVDKHVRLDVDDVEPMLFPETAEIITQAVVERAEKIVPITHDYHVIPEAKEDGVRTYGPMSWRRADGTGKHKTCPHSVTGVIVVGVGRGEAFKVCVAKKACAVHWGSEQREAKKRASGAATGGKTGEDTWESMRRKQEEEQRRDNEQRERWKKAVPAILKALAEVVKKTPAKAKGLLADLVLSYLGGRDTEGADAEVPRGSTAEDLVRHAAFRIMCGEAMDWSAPREFPKLAKDFGVDTRKILDEVAPEPGKDAKPRAKKAPKKSSRRR